MAALTAGAVAPRVRRRLRRHGYGPTRMWLQARARQPAGPEKVEELVWVAEAVMRRLPGHFSCLDRSLVAWWLLGGDSAATIRLGVAPPQTGSQPLFHAWVEAHGAVVNDAADVATTYLPFVGGDSVPSDRFD